MNVKEIRELAQILRENELKTLEITEGETHIRMERDSAQTTAPVQGPIVSAQTTPQEKRDEGVNFGCLTEVKSPLIGVFYAAPSPESEPFVKTGSLVKKGDVLCIVEAMKLMNEIVAEADGMVVDVCADNGDVVEFGQTLFKLS